MWPARQAACSITSRGHGRVGYLAPEDFLVDLREELGDAVSDIHGRLRGAAPYRFDGPRT